jgi:hypothetical protein
MTEKAISPLRPATDRVPIYPPAPYQTLNGSTTTEATGILFGYFFPNDIMTTAVTDPAGVHCAGAVDAAVYPSLVGYRRLVRRCWGDVSHLQVSVWPDRSGEGTKSRLAVHGRKRSPVHTIGRALNEPVLLIPIGLG